MENVDLKNETPTFGNVLLSDVYQEAVKVADGIERQVTIVMPDNTDYDTIVKVSIFTADRMKSVIPMYTGNINPKWKLYDTVIEVLKGRLNGR